MPPFRLLNGGGAILSVIFLLIITQTGLVAAQPLLDEEERTQKEPPKFHFTPSLSVAELYDDNILLRSVRRESDLITRVRAGLIVAVDQATVRWLTDVNFEADFYRDHPDLSTYDRAQTLDTRLTIRPNPRWTFEFGDAFVHSNDPIVGPTPGTVVPGGTVTPPAGGGTLPGGGAPPPVDLGEELILQRTEYYRNVLSLRGAYRLTPRLTADIEGITRFTDYTDDRLIDSSSNEIRGSLPYILTPVSTITPQYQYRDFYFRHRGHTEAHTLTLRMEHRFTSTLTGRASGGPILIIDRGTVQPDFIFGLGADQSYSETIVFRADFSRDVAVVGGLAGAFATNIFSGSVTAHVTKKFDSIVAGSWAFQQALLSTQTDLDTLRFRLEEQFKVTAWFRIFLSYEFMRQNYHSGARDIYNNRIFAGVILSDTYPPRP